jgi:hypothetical protein
MWADQAAKIALEEDINGRELYPPQELMNRMKKTDAKYRQEMWAQEENTMRFRKETIEWKDDSTNLSRKEQVLVFKLRTGYTRATHRHFIHRKNAITRMPLLWGVVHNRTHTMGVYGNYEREREEKPEPRKMYGQMEQRD